MKFVCVQVFAALILVSVRRFRQTRSKSLSRRIQCSMLRRVPSRFPSDGRGKNGTARAGEGRATDAVLFAGCGASKIMHALHLGPAARDRIEKYACPGNLISPHSGQDGSNDLVEIVAWIGADNCKASGREILDFAALLSSLTRTSSSW